MFWPFKLSYYPHPGHWPFAIVLLSTAFVVSISLLGFLTYRKRPWLLVGWFWYLGTLVPVIGIVQLADIAMANRYSYIPMIGVLTMVVWGVHELTKRSKHQAVFSFAALTASLIFCIYLTGQQIVRYKDSVAVWRYNFETTGNIEVAEYALGLSLDHQGQTDEGVKILKEVVNAIPGRPDFHFTLGNMLMKQAKLDDAIHHYAEAVNLAPDFNKARYNMGLCLLEKGLTNEAVVQFQKMIQINGDAQACNAMGAISYADGRYDDAIKYFKDALKQKADFDAFRNLGVTLVNIGRADEAAPYLKQGLKLNPNWEFAREQLMSLKAASVDH